MSLFGKILDKLGFHKAPAATSSATVVAPPPPAATPTAPFTPTSAPLSPATATATTAAPVSATPHASAIPVVDVVHQLETLAASYGEKLNWKTSIVDLLKLLGIESSLTARKELAIELDCPSEKMEDSAQMNMWLHKTVLQKIADNGGNIPKELLH